MKRLNRKGFTLVELLAVIIILAIVVGITIPAVLTTTSKAKAKAFKTAAQTSADWIERQYQIINTGLEDEEMATIDEDIKAVIEDATDSEQTFTTTGSGSGPEFARKFVYATGLNTNNIEQIKFKITNGRACVTLTAKAGGDYEGAGDATLNSNKNQIKGGAC